MNKSCVAVGKGVSNEETFFSIHHPPILDPLPVWDLIIISLLLAWATMFDYNKHDYDLYGDCDLYYGHDVYGLFDSHDQFDYYDLFGQLWSVRVLWPEETTYDLHDVYDMLGFYNLNEDHLQSLRPVWRDYVWPVWRLLQSFSVTSNENLPKSINILLK